MPPSVGVIGAGVIGASCARFLDDAGVEVTLYDPGAGRAQSTWASAGLLVHEDHGHPDTWHVLARRGLALWPDIGGRFTQLEYHRVGMLLLGPDAETIAWREANGYSNELAEWRGQPALLMPEACVVRSPRVAPALLDGLPCRTTRVETVDEVLREHDIAVIAAGTWSQALLEQVRVPVRVAPRRGQMMVFDRGDLPHVVRTTKRQVALPRADGRVAVGVTWEDVGFDSGTDDAILDELEAWAREQVPGLGVRETAWAGLRPWSDREGPTIGWASDRVIVAVGHHRDGLVLAPATGELIRDLVLERAPSVDPAPFAVPTR